MNGEFNTSQEFLGPSEELPSRFIGREKELAFLNKCLVQDKAKVVGVIGKAGIGKTALILQFARQHAGNFPGGIYHFPPIPSIDIFSSSLELIPKTNKSILIILEEFGHLPYEYAGNLLSAVFNNRPTAQLLLTSQLIYTEAINNLLDNNIILKLNDSINFLQIDDSVSSLMTGPFIRPSIIGPDGNPLTKNHESYKQIVTEISEVSEELLRKLSNNPELLHELSARKFEEVIAEILHRQGYEIAITPFSKDGGKDICAASKSSLGTFLYIVQCKKYAPNRPVGVELVRELYGIVQVEKITAGIIATTSYFTRGAKDLQSKLLYQISLKDYFEIQRWLKSILG
ncbi:restriction endonuclease [Chloroflexota bacterium]